MCTGTKFGLGRWEFWTGLDQFGANINLFSDQFGLKILNRFGTGTDAKFGSICSDNYLSI